MAPQGGWAGGGGGGSEDTLGWREGVNEAVDHQQKQLGSPKAKPYRSMCPSTTSSVRNKTQFGETPMYAKHPKVRPTYE